jgi:DNA gyrase/topoisomerase IV subunit B
MSVATSNTSLKFFPFKPIFHAPFETIRLTFVIENVAFLNSQIELFFAKKQMENI